MSLIEEFLVSQFAAHPIAWSLVALLLFVIFRAYYPRIAARFKKIDDWEESLCGLATEVKEIVCRVEEILKDRQQYFDQSVEHHNVEYNWLTELNTTVNELYQKLDTFVLEAQETRKETQRIIGEMKDVLQQHSNLELELFRSLIDRIGNGGSSRISSSSEQGSQKKK